MIHQGQSRTPRAAPGLGLDLRYVAIGDAGLHEQSGVTGAVTAGASF
jgi:hypothetical protein